MDLRLLLTLFQFLLITLKITGFTDASWTLVLLPLWLPLAITLFCFAVCGVIWVSMGREGRNQYRQHKRIEAMLKAVRR